MIPTMAVKITPKTYPIAIACLAGGFASYPLKKVMGRYLVINELTPMRINKDRSPSLVLSNAWMQVDYFEARFTFIKKELDDQFAEVRQN